MGSLLQPMPSKSRKYESSMQLNYNAKQQFPNVIEHKIKHDTDETSLCGVSIKAPHQN